MNEGGALANLRVVLALVMALVGSLIPDLSVASGRDGAGQQFRNLGPVLSEAMLAGDLPRAESIARERLMLAGRTGQAHRLGRAYYELGRVLELRGRLDDAELMLGKAIPLLEDQEGKGGHHTVAALTELAEVRASQGRYVQAELLLKDVLKRQLAVAPNDLDTVSEYNQLAVVELNLDHVAEAQRLVELAQKVPVDPSTSRAATQGKVPLPVPTAQGWLKRHRRNSETILARVQLQQGHYSEAIGAVERALAEDATESSRDPRNSIELYTTLGLAEIRLGKSDAAEAHLRKALEQNGWQTGYKSRDAAMAAATLGALMLWRGHLEEAEVLLRQSVAVVSKADSLHQKAMFERLLAKVLLQQRSPAKMVEAWEHYKRSLDDVDKLFVFTQGASDQTRESFIQQFGAMYVEALDLLATLHEAQPSAGYDRLALSVVSRTQSRIFTELLRRSDFSAFANDSTFSALRQRQQRASDEVSRLRRSRTLAFRVSDQIPANASSDDDDNDEAVEIGVNDALVRARIEAQRQRLDQDLHEATATLTAVERELWTRYPRYMELVQPRPVTVEQLQGRLLHPEESLISFYLLPSSVLIFVVDPHEFHLIQRPIDRDELASWIEAARRPSEQAGQDAQALGQLDPALLFHLYETLIAPAEPWLRPGHRVLFVGDGPLHTLPMEMLITKWGPLEQQAFQLARSQSRAGKAPQLSEYAGLSYLGERYHFAYLPSLAALESARLYRRPAVTYNRDFVSFADPDFNAAATGPTRALAQEIALRLRGGSSSLGIPSLPETADEARDIAQIVGGSTQIFLGQKAQEHAVKTLGLDRTRYVHFATHGLLGGDFVQLKAAIAAASVKGATKSGERRNAGIAESNAGAMPIFDLIEPDNAAPAIEESQRGEPALLLSLTGDMQGEDGLLTMSEVVGQINLNAELVVLSACNTAGEGSAAREGEGFAGLTRAFMFAGAQGLIVSHWSVDSKSTQQLMTETFRRLRSGDDHLTALEAARTMVRTSTVQVDKNRQSHGHPYFWAPFVYVGD
ncbi:MAG: CHAT domain-containing protein [Paucibacter sp.]|nr:CHAT domain-containing protein [Roseateles sp.]